MRKVSYSIENWPLVSPFRITGHTFTDSRVLHVQISERNLTGHGEASGVYYLDETAESMAAQIEVVIEDLRNGLDRDGLRKELSAGGARNAIDSALWDIEAKLTGKSIWALTGINPGPVTTVNTVGLDTPDKMAALASAMSTNKIKVKLDRNDSIARIAAIRTACPDAEIVVDVNQGWSFDLLVEIAPHFQELGVAMIEQPLPRCEDAELEGYESPVPLCADESCLDTSELEQASRRYQIINIKLDKTGGLTEALDLANQAKSRGLKLMIGNMVGTSLAMAPGFVVAQLCDYVDLDGPLFLNSDRKNAMTYINGRITAPQPALWG